MVVRRKCKIKMPPPFTKHFPRYREIQCYLKMIKRLYPNKVRLERLGCSFEGRSIKMIVIQSNRLSPKHSVMIEGGIHAREWLSHTTVLYLIDYVLNHPSLLSLMDFYIIPCLNPDGYEYTHTHDRLWRKSMNPNGSRNKKFWGVDLNRNFPYSYGRQGSSSCRSSFMYRGKSSLSEPETKCLHRAMCKYSRKIKLFIAIHCYGHLIMYPWGFTKTSIPDENDLHDCAMAGKRAMKRRYSNSKFRVGSTAKKMYLSSGGSSDYARGTHNIKFSYTMELHKMGKSGFISKPKHIKRVAKETIAGIKAMVKYVHRYYNSSKKIKRKHSTCNSCLCKRPRLS